MLETNFFIEAVLYTVFISHYRKFFEQKGKIMLFEKQTYKRIKEHVAYIYHKCKCDDHGFKYRWKNRINELLPERYAILDDEKSVVIKLLNEFREDIVGRFLRDSLQIDKFFADLKDDDYLYMYLQAFFSDLEFNEYLKGFNFYQEESRETYPADGYVATCSLTNEGRIFYKVYYAVELYCESKGLFKQKSSHKIKEVLDTNYVEMSCYRP